MSELKLVDEGSVSFDMMKAFISNTTSFPPLEDEEIKRLIKWFHVYSILPGTNIFTEGNIGASLCFIESGEVLIFKETTQSEFVKIASVHKGDSIGEMSILDGQPVSATAVASEKTIMLIITRPNFEEMVKQDSDLGIKILWNIAQTISLRLRKTTGVLSEISTSSQ